MKRLRWPILGVAMLLWASGAPAQESMFNADAITIPERWAKPLATRGAAKVPPRSIVDVIALLDQYRPDPAKVEALLAIVNREPPPDATGDALFRFYRERADAAQGLGMVTREMADLRRALEFVKGTEDEWTVMQDIFIAEALSGNIITALKIKEQMAQLSGTRDSRLIIDHSNAAGLYALIGDIDAARAALRRAQVVMYALERSQAWGTWGDSWISQFERARGLILDAEGKHAEAETAKRNSLAATERFLEVAPRAYAVSGTRVEQRVEVYRYFRGLVQVGLAENLELQGRLTEAELTIRDALQSSLSRLGRYTPPTALVVGAFVTILNEQGRFRDAEAMARAAIDIHKNIGSVPESRLYTLARRQLGMALVSQSRWSDAVAVYEQMRADLARDPASLEKLGQGDVDWALALVKIGRSADAVAMLEPLLKHKREQLGVAHYQVAEHRGFLAVALAETGQRQRALGEFQEAVKVLLTRAPVDADEESTSPARARRLVIILEGYLKLLHDARDELRGMGFDAAAEAFRVADAVHGGSAQRALAAAAARAAAGSPALAELVRREQDSTQQVAVLYSTLLRLLNAPQDQQLPQVVSQVRARIQELEKERRALFADLEKRFPAYLNLINPRPATLEQARAALREGEVLLSVLTTTDRTYVWAVPKSGAVAFHAVPMGDDEVARAVGHLRRALDPGETDLNRLPEFDVTQAAKLYGALLKPVEGAWNGAGSLMVVANGALAQLPFGLLPTRLGATEGSTALRFDQYKAVPWLIRDVAVTQLPAVNTLVTLRALPPGNAQRSAFAGFGDPQFGAQPAGAPVQVAMRNLSIRRVTAVALRDGSAPTSYIPYGALPPLPDTRGEILAIAQALSADPNKDVFLGTAASRQSVKEANLGNRRIIAFATHGLVPGDFPNLDEPALALSAPDGKAETGLLTLSDILTLKMDADWVVLSACNTAAGDGAGAEAISGLGRGFFYAGSRALLVTHWPVETRSARQLVTTLFERYAADPVLTRAEALRQASLAVMEDSAKDASGKALFSYAHPLFWAPYALVGDGGR